MLCFPWVQNVDDLIEHVSSLVNTQEALNFTARSSFREIPYLPGFPGVSCPCSQGPGVSLWPFQSSFEKLVGLIMRQPEGESCSQSLGGGNHGNAAHTSVHPSTHSPGLPQEVGHPDSLSFQHPSFSLALDCTLSVNQWAAIHSLTLDGL